MPRRRTGGRGAAVDHMPAPSPDAAYRAVRRRAAMAWALVLLVSTVGGCGARAQEGGSPAWPGWRGPARNGVSPESGWSWAWPESGPQVLWTAEVGYGFSSFAVVGGRAFTMGNVDDVDSVYCLDAATGEVVWKHSYECPREPLSYEGGPSATPIVDGERVYTLSKFGHCFCLEAQTGKAVWSRKFERSPAGSDDYRVDWGFAGSPLVVGERLILPVGGGCLALDKGTGETLWDNGPGRSGYSSPVPCRIGEREAFCLLSGHEVIGIDAAGGDVLWRLPWRTTWDQNAADVVVHEGRLFVSTGHGVGCAQFDLARTPPEPIWQSKAMRSYLNACVLWEGNLYGFTEEGPQLRCLDWQTGEVRWSAEGLGQGSLIVVDGKLVILSERGRLVIARASPEAYEPLAEGSILSGRCWTSPAFAQGRVYARNAAGDVVCVQMPRGQ